jgi:hypothetical protein
MNHKYLLITSYFPPLGGPGVQRQLYYVHYADTFGWEPIVLTVKDVIYHAYDESLFSKIPQTVKIERTESFEFGRLLYYYHTFSSLIRKIIPIQNQKEKQGKNKKFSDRQLRFGRLIREWLTFIDDRIFWIPFAYPRALSVDKKFQVDIIVARGGPHSNMVLAYYVAKKLNKPLVIDLADPWLDYPYLNYPTRLHKKINMYWEEKVFRYATKIAVSCGEIEKSILRRYIGISPNNIVIVTNGYDERDFTSSTGLEEINKHFTITHVGSLGWIRLESFRVLCEALKIVFENNSD